jgi:lipopolysaccharide/colanic/teichoic acid biosynthesis glycosyltransferase
MLKEHSFLLKHVIALTDIVLLTVVFSYSHWLVSKHASLKPALDYWFMFVGFLIFYVYFAWTRQLFSLLQFAVMTDLAWRTILIFISAGVIGAAILYVVPDFHDSRRLHLTFVSFSCVAVTTFKEILRLILEWLRRHDRNTTPVLVFGRGRGLTQLVKQIANHPQWGLRVRELLDPDTTPQQFERTLLSSHVEEVFFCMPRSSTTGGYDIDPYLQVCEEVGRPARVFLNLHEAVPEARWQYQPFMGRPSMISHTAELDPDRLLIKRLFDVVCSAAGCLLTLALLPALALAIRIESPGPLIVKRERIGKGGKRFRLYAFRCERISDGHASGTTTRVGAFLRSLGLEQLPQFCNVLRGEMSLVGVRPAAPNELDSYQTWHHRRLSHKPGMTGLWRVNPTGAETLDELVQLDLLYADQWSIWLDLRIAARTLFGLTAGRHTWVEPQLPARDSA